MFFLRVKRPGRETDNSALILKVLNGLLLVFEVLRISVSGSTFRKENQVLVKCFSIGNPFKQIEIAV